ncbi:MAG: hypothetical protein LBS82_02820 [Spirochaetaceae bacterium]|nr:hypothetical protein [Spirochaetaceae bacterium]
MFSVFKIFSHFSLCLASGKCLASVMRHFFFLQYKVALFPGKIPLSDVDNPLDAAVPFKPEWVAVYLDFSTFWIRTQGFLLEAFGRRALPFARDFILSMGGLYRKAAEVYARNVSTTRRPRYLGNLRFILIHAVDPHLMCIPSLHVMVVIRAYTAFRAMVGALGGEARFAAEVDDVRRHALAIAESILYVKQHSVNCIPAAMYAMTRFDGALFPPEEAERFVGSLFASADGMGAEDVAAIKSRIVGLYAEFLREGEGAEDWTEPLVEFLRLRRRP